MTRSFIVQNTNIRRGEYNYGSSMLNTQSQSNYFQEASGTHGPNINSGVYNEPRKLLYFPT